MALPNSNITTTMVGNELGLSTRNVGNLCSSTTINKWSKWKPVRNSKQTGLIEGDFKNSHFGLRVTEFAPAATPNPNVHFYEYVKPTGGSLSPYRLGDFRGYEKNALPSYQCGMLQSPVNKALIPYSVYWSIYKNNNVGNAPLGDVEIVWNGTAPNGMGNLELREMLVGVEIRNSSNTVVSTQYSTNNIDSIISIQIDVENIPVGNYTCHLFLFPEGYPSRRFPFPAYETFPNHQPLEVIFAYPFTMAAQLGYRIHSSGTIQQFNLPSQTTINVSNPGSTTAIGMKLRIEATDSFILDLTDLQLYSPGSVLFSPTTLNDVHGWTVNSKSTGLPVSGNIVSFTPGSWVEVTVRAYVSILPNGITYPSPYGVNYQMLYKGTQMINQGATWRNV